MVGALLKLHPEDDVYRNVSSSSCSTVGQDAEELHYCVLDFEFDSLAPALPFKVTLQAFPLDGNIVIQNA